MVKTCMIEKCKSAFLGIRNEFSSVHHPAISVDAFCNLFTAMAVEYLDHKHGAISKLKYI